MADFSDFYPVISGGTNIQYTTITADVTTGAFQGYYVDTTAAVAVTLHAGAQDDKVFVGDLTGNAENMPITITPNGTDTIMGGATFTINVAFQMFEFVKVGTDWRFAGGVGEGVGGGETPGGGVDPAADYTWTGQHIFDYTGGQQAPQITNGPSTTTVGAVNIRHDTTASGSFGSAMYDVATGTNVQSGYLHRVANAGDDAFPRIFSGGVYWDFKTNGELVGATSEGGQVKLTPDTLQHTGGSALILGGNSTNSGVRIRPDVADTAFQVAVQSSSGLVVSMPSAFHAAIDMEDNPINMRDSGNQVTASLQYNETLQVFRLRMGGNESRKFQIQGAGDSVIASFSPAAVEGLEITGNFHCNGWADNLAMGNYIIFMDYDDDVKGAGLRTFVRDGIMTFSHITGGNPADTAVLAAGGAPTLAAHLCKKSYTDANVLAAMNSIADAIDAGNTTALRAEIANMQSAYNSMIATPTILDAE